MRVLKNAESLYWQQEIFFIKVLRPFQQIWAKTREPGEKPPDYS